MTIPVLKNRMEVVMLQFIAGLLIGGSVGLFVAAMCFAAKTDSKNVK